MVLKDDDGAAIILLFIDLLKYLLLLFICLLVVQKLFYFFEMAYVEFINKKLFVNHVYFRKKRLTKEGKAILHRNFSFYRRLSMKDQSNFDHRVQQFIRSTEFIGKDLEVTEEMKMLISGTLVKLTFGLRDYNIATVERIILYPEAFYSETNKTYHKGEFNIGYRALVFSWADVLHGYEIEDDNLNLAIHEWTHAIHFYYMSVRRRSTSAAIFLDSYVELSQMLDNDPALKAELIQSKFLRAYAYTNQFEFLAVLLETFIESPEAFKKQFPGIYGKVRTMISFNFANY